MRRLASWRWLPSRSHCRSKAEASHTRTVRPALPSNDRQLWIKLLHLDLEAHPPQAAILSLTLTAEPGSTSKVQLGLFSPQLPEPTRLDVTLARIRAIVGEDYVGRAVLKDTHQPDGFRMEPFTVPLRSAKARSRDQPSRGHAAASSSRRRCSVTLARSAAGSHFSFASSAMTSNVPMAPGYERRLVESDALGLRAMGPGRAIAAMARCCAAASFAI